MSYIKYGVVTRIDIVKNKDNSLKYITNSFNLNMFNKIRNSYYLKDKYLKKNLKRVKTLLFYIKEIHILHMKMDIEHITKQMSSLYKA